jgi:transcriptional regulator of arginine metabolism
VAEEAASLPPLARALREYLLDFRPAQNLLVLKTPPGGAQPLAAAVDAERLPQTAGTVAGDDTVLIITASRKACVELQKKLEALLK